MTQLKRLASLCVLAMMAFIGANAGEGWIDVTEHYIKNPNYDGCDFSHWEGTELSQVGGWDNAEHYQKSYDTYQVVTGLMPGGKYRLSLSAFYRCGEASTDWWAFNDENSDEYRFARLYAKTGGEYFDTGIALCSSGAVEQSLGGGTQRVGEGANRLYIPNNMTAAHHWFEAGHYLNTLEFTAGADGTATIGIFKDFELSGDWTCIDTWRLEYYGELVDVEGIEIDESSTEIMVGEMLQLHAHIKPSNATYQGILWETTDESVATVDERGMVSGIAPGKCVVRAKSESRPNKYASIAISVKAASVTAGSLVINEIQAANLDMFMDPSFNYGSWIELYNTTDRMMTLGKLYVTDDPGNLKKFRLPNKIGYIEGKGFRTLWFDHNGIWNLGEHTQIPFKLDYDGGTIIISDGETIIAQQDYPQAVARTSYARTTDCGAEWGVTSTPTPGASNNGSKFATEQLAAPEVDKDAQLFTGKLNVTVAIPAGCTLRYTTDGSTPTLDCGQTSSDGKFTVSETTPFRFRLFKDGMLPSQVVTRSYILNDKDFTLPIISVNGGYEDLFGWDYGVFVQGSGNGRPGAGQSSPCNWNMDWDRPVNFEYIGNEGDGGEYRMLFNQEVDLARCGGWSRAWTPYSFKLKAAKYYYGQNTMDYTFFPDKPFIKNKTLQIRNGGNDNNCRIKDPALQQIISRSGLYVDGQQWVPVMHFINGEYRGVINMREPNNKHFAYANYGIDPDEMDQFEISPDSNYVQMVGTKDAWNELYELAKDAANPDTYAEICNRVDIDELLNYLVVQIYLGGDDWPKNNLKGFRDRNGGKFHFVLFDLDHAFNKGSDSFTHFFKNSKTWTFDELRGSYYDGNGTKHTLSGRRTEEIEFVTIITNLFENETFKQEFINRFCVITGSVFEPNRCKKIVNEMATTMEKPMSYPHATSNNWGGWWGQPQGDSPWNTANDIINKLSFSRISTLTSAMKSHLKIGDTRQEVKIASNVDGASLLVNGFEIPTGYMNGYIFGTTTVKAAPVAGYRFLGWKNGGNSNYTTTSLIKSGAAWSYYDAGSLDGKTWKTGTLPAGWKSGKTPIGYGKNEIVTKTSGNKPTYYFRTSVSLQAAPAKDAEFKLSYTIDDGFIIYVNGTEAARYNMPAGNVGYDTFATSYAQDNPDTGEMTLPASLFSKGENIIAVEVHNNSTSSTDIMWNASLTMQEQVVGTSEFVSEDDEYTLPESGKIDIMAVYEPVSDEELAADGMFPVRINEVSAGNTMYVNDYFKKDDWIELYNTTSEPVDVAGMFLSDNPEKPQKYQIAGTNAAQTIIEPHGYLVVWASKRDDKGGQLHASFKLANGDGEVVILSSQDGEWADTLRYNEHTNYESVGRYPDGGNNIYIMSAPTIGTSNRLTLDAEYLYTSVYDPTTTDGIIAITDNATVKSMAYYTLNGMHVGNASGQLERGVYIVKYTMSDGSVKSKKIIIK